MLDLEGPMLNPPPTHTHMFVTVSNIESEYDIRTNKCTIVVRFSFIPVF
jgi:hypothetical protein